MHFFQFLIFFFFILVWGKILWLKKKNLLNRQSQFKIFSYIFILIIHFCSVLSSYYLFIEDIRVIVQTWGAGEGFFQDLACLAWLGLSHILFLVILGCGKLPPHPPADRRLYHLLHWVRFPIIIRQWSGEVGACSALSRRWVFFGWREKANGM